MCPKLACGPLEDIMSLLSLRITGLSKYSSGTNQNVPFILSHKIVINLQRNVLSLHSKISYLPEK